MVSEAPLGRLRKTRPARPCTDPGLKMHFSWIKVVSGLLMGSPRCGRPLPLIRPRGRLSAWRAVGGRHPLLWKPQPAGEALGAAAGAGAGRGGPRSLEFSRCRTCTVCACSNPCLDSGAGEGPWGRC